MPEVTPLTVAQVMALRGKAAEATAKRVQYEKTLAATQKALVLRRSEEQDAVGAANEAEAALQAQLDAAARPAKK